MIDDDEQGAPYLRGREKQEKRKRERIPYEGSRRPANSIPK